jgi:4-hydroxybenzoate polyprenyltransferase
MFWKRVRLTLEMIKFEHSVFALPFAMTGALLAVREGGAAAQRLPWRLLWIVTAMVAARSAAMAFNRLVDEPIDGRNPRTSTRHLPAGLLSRAFAWGFVIATSAFAHLVLGFALGIAPAAAWIAIRGSLDVRILWLTAAVTFWTAGFDIIYSCQDYDFDVREGLFSIPRVMGIAGALRIAQALHLAMILSLVSLVWTLHLGMLALAGVAAVAALLLYEHSLVKPNDLSRVNAAFFTMNGYVSMLFFVFWAADIFLHSPGV